MDSFVWPLLSKLMGILRLEFLDNAAVDEMLLHLIVSRTTPPSDTGGRQRSNLVVFKVLSGS